MATIYTCPMHPEIEQNKPGRCQKCGMKLVEKGKEMMHHDNSNVESSYKPLIIVISFITLVTFILALRSLLMEEFKWTDVIMHFMAGFFLVFSGFKLMDLKGFAEGYSTYDLLAKRWFAYGYIYPFIELFFAASMIGGFAPPIILWAELLIMLFSGVGVGIKLARHEKFQCACLGTFLKVPLTKITLIEDFGMAFLALLLIFLRT